MNRPQAEIVLLDDRSRPRFRELTFPSYRQFLVSPGGQEGAPLPLALAAEQAGRPIGLALFSLTDAEAQWLSLYVTAERRGQGLGTALLESAKQHLAKSGFRRLNAVFTGGKPDTEFWSEALVRHGFAQPEPRMMLIRFTVEQANRTPWFGKFRQRSELEIVSFAALPAEKVEALKQTGSSWVPPDLVPWQFAQSDLDPSSVAGLLRGELVGWVLNHRIDGRTIRFTCSYIRPDLAARGRILPLYCESIQRLTRDPLVQNCSMTVPWHHLPMRKFAERWCAPEAAFVGVTYGTSCPIYPWPNDKEILR